MRKKQQMPRQIDGPVFGYWQALYMAFYSSRLYVDVAKRWRGFCFVYLLILVAIMAVPLSVRIICDFNHYFNERIISTLEKIPPVPVRNGAFIFDKPMPYLIKDKAGVVVAMIDTNRIVSGMDAAYPNLVMQISKHAFYFRLPKINLFLNLPEQPGNHEAVVGTLDNTTPSLFVAKNWGKTHGILKMKWLTAMMVYPFLIPFLVGMFFSCLLVLAMLSQVFSWLILRYKLTFKEAVRILIVASTAQISVFLILWATQAVFPNITLFYMALSTIYFSYAVLSVKRESKMMIHS